MKDLGSRDYTAVVEGDITKRYTAIVPTDIDRSRARFIQVGVGGSSRWVDIMGQMGPPVAITVCLIKLHLNAWHACPLVRMMSQSIW